MLFFWIVGGMIANLFIRHQVNNQVSMERWEVIETNIEGSWTYWRDKKNPELCFINLTAVTIFPPISASSVSYVPCDKLNQNLQPKSPKH